MTARFEIGKTYQTRSICDHECIYEVVVVSRTERTVTIKSAVWNKRCKVQVDDNGDEWIMPEHYSMAPVFRASRMVA